MRTEIMCLMILILFGSCTKEDDLIPSEGLEFSFSLPQGEHDYDAKIVDWFERCGFYILYQFNPDRDLYWNGSFSNKLKNDLFSGIYGEIADESYVGEQLELVEEGFLNFYQDTLLTRCMPLKLLLCAKLQEGDRGVLKDIDVYADGLDVIAVNHGNNEVVGLSAIEKNTFKNSMNVAFLQRMISVGKMTLWDGFVSLSDYEVSGSNYFERGFIGGYYSSKYPDDDLESYIDAILTLSEEELYAEPEEGDDSYRGMLHEKKDKSGLIKKKYDIVIEHYKEYYNVDLLKIRDFKFE